MGNKSWWQSKTVWSDVLTILLGIYASVTPVLATHGINLPPTTSGFLAVALSVLGGLGIYGRTSANTTISPK